MGMMVTNVLKSRRRPFSDIRRDILRALALGRSTVNDLSRKTDINWKTVDNHLIYLCGRGWAEKVFDSPYVKIFDITEDGHDHLSKVQTRLALNLKKPDNKKRGHAKE